jgi:Ca2+-binding EF-hand superfamily protein
LKGLGMSINEIDTTHISASGITFEKFVELAQICLKHPNWAANEMNELFVLFDKDSSGNIDPIELRRVFTRYGESLTEVELEDQLREYDIDGDSEV